MSEYADRDHEAQGEHYVRHVSAMTAEGLHAKSAIAAELAHRDIEIAALRKRAEEDAATIAELRGSERWQEINALAARVEETSARLINENEALTKRAEEAEADAARWRHATQHGFPVRNQTPGPGFARLWIAFDRAGMERYGATPTAAIDAARKETP